MKLTDEELTDIQWHIARFNGGTVSDSTVLALVGELRAERTRTETLRAALNDAVIGLVAVYGPDSSMVSDGRAALAASVEETP